MYVLSHISNMGIYTEDELHKRCLYSNNCPISFIHVLFTILSFHWSPFYITSNVSLNTHKTLFPNLPTIYLHLQNYQN